jgi:hypothetical protein
MGTEHVGIFVYDVDNGMVLANFDIVNANQIVVHLSEAIICNVIVFGYNVIGAATIAGSTVQVGSIELTESVNGNLLVNGQALATNDRIDAVLALAPEEFDTFKEVADNLALKADAADVYTKTEVDTSLATKANTTHNHAFADITSKPTTVSGYGITDAYTKSEVDTLKSQYLMTSGGTMTGAITSFRETHQALASGSIDLSAANQFSITITANTTFSVANVPPSGQVMGFILEITNGGSKTIGYWTGVKWAGGTAPTLTAAGVDILGFYTRDGGVTWRGMVLAKDSK